MAVLESSVLPVGYGCTTCIGNSGPLPEEISKAVNDRPVRRRGAVRQPQLRGPHHPDVKMNFLASPPLVVAYALAGTINIDLHRSRWAWTTTATTSLLPRHLAAQ